MNMKCTIHACVYMYNMYMYMYIIVHIRTCIYTCVNYTCMYTYMYTYSRRQKSVPFLFRRTIAVRFCHLRSTVTAYQKKERSKYGVKTVKKPVV